jgi:TonB family protein
MRAGLIIFILACELGSAFAAEPPVAPEDILYKVSPRYPSSERSANIGGTGRFRMIVNFNTGKVTEVVILKSTGSDILDREAIFSLRRWRFRPGKVRKVDLPITFITARNCSSGLSLSGPRLADRMRWD